MAACHQAARVFGGGLLPQAVDADDNFRHVFSMGFKGSEFRVIFIYSLSRVLVITDRLKKRQ